MSELWREVQTILKGKGYGLGSGGPAKDGVDGDPGDLTAAATLAELRKYSSPAGEVTVVAEPPRLPALPARRVTARIALELVGHEAIVQEAYKDSKGIWTWGVGVTSRSGHMVERYKDNPQPIRRCLEIYIWLLETRYLPDVLEEFDGFDLTEAQLGAALSFHYNTGKIGKASWCDSFKAGKIAQARAQFMEWRKPPEIIERREKERDLFFDGRWSGDGKPTLYQVSKPSYSPRWSSAKEIDIRADIEALLAGDG